MNKRICFSVAITVVVFVIASVCFVTNGLYQNKQLFKAIENDDYNSVCKAIEKGAWVNARKHQLYFPAIQDTNPTPLICACEKGNTRIVDLLLLNGARINKKDNYTNQTALLASLKGWKSNRFLLAMALIKKGADIHAIQENACSPFTQALIIGENDTEQTKQQALELLEYLVSNNVDRKVFMSRENAVTYAVHYRNDLAVKYLIENGYNDVNEKDGNGETALMVAVKYNRKNTVTQLIEMGANTTVVNVDGKTAYDYAIESGNEEIIRLLEEAEQQTASE